MVVEAIDAVRAELEAEVAALQRQVSALQGETDDLAKQVKKAKSAGGAVKAKYGVVVGELNAVCECL